jgi:hypothetical protein
MHSKVEGATSSIDYVGLMAGTCILATAARHAWHRDTIKTYFHMALQVGHDKK